MSESVGNGRGVFLRHPSQYLRRNKLKSISDSGGETPARSVSVSDIYCCVRSRRSAGGRTRSSPHSISSFSYFQNRLRPTPLYYNIFSFPRFPSSAAFLSSSFAVVSLAYIIDLNDISSSFPPHLRARFALREA